MKKGKSETRLPKIGGDGGIRTLDLTDANRTLSQLSYAPICCFFLEQRYYTTKFLFVKKKIDYFFQLV